MIVRKTSILPAKREAVFARLRGALLTGCGDGGGITRLGDLRGADRGG